MNSGTQGLRLLLRAFFPFRDGSRRCRRRPTAIIQPGGSIRDDEVIARCRTKTDLLLCSTGLRPL